jgi:predicted MFS family arabinose efflux permease
MAHDLHVTEGVAG